jgi:hypothetical protein
MKLGLLNNTRSHHLSDLFDEQAKKGHILAFFSAAINS